MTPDLGDVKAGDVFLVKHRRYIDDIDAPDRSVYFVEQLRPWCGQNVALIIQIQFRTCGRAWFMEHSKALEDVIPAYATRGTIDDWYQALDDMNAELHRSADRIAKEASE